MPPSHISFQVERDRRGQTTGPFASWWGRLRGWW